MNIREIGEIHEVFKNIAEWLDECEISLYADDDYEPEPPYSREEMLTIVVEIIANMYESCASVLESDGTFTITGYK